MLFSATAPNPHALTTNHYANWLRTHFPRAVAHPFADRHLAAWEWFADLVSGTKPRALIACWPRGGGKSTTIELGCVYVGMRETRRFVLYVSGKQAQADTHVQAIAGKLETLGMDRSVNKYNQSRGWTQQILRAANGFNVVSLGLDAAARGIKLDDYRPDLIIFDDVDSRHDSADVRAKKIETITQSIMPSGSEDCAYAFVQNKIGDDSVMAQVLDGRADMLQDRLPPTVEPAVRGLSVARVPNDDGALRYVAAGEPTWAGQSLTTCTQQINDWGLRAFLREAQHETDQEEAGLWQRERDITPFRDQRPLRLVRIVVGVDPPGGATECGIVVAGLDNRGHGYVLADFSLKASPEAWGQEVVRAYVQQDADRVLGEVNFGGDMVDMVVRTAAKETGVRLAYRHVRASRGKDVRAEPIQALYEEGRVHHVGTLVELEREMCTWQSGVTKESPNRMDALVWALTELMLTRTGATQQSNYLDED